MKKFILIISLGALGCSAPKRFASGKYVVSHISEKGPGFTVVKFEGLKNDYRIFSDTLKYRDTITINVISVYYKKRRQ